MTEEQEKLEHIDIMQEELKISFTEEDRSAAGVLVDKIISGAYRLLNLVSALKLDNKPVVEGITYGIMTVSIVGWVKNPLFYFAVWDFKPN